MSDKDLSGRDISLGLTIVSGIVRIVEMIMSRRKPKPEPKPDDKDDRDDDDQRGGPCWSTPPYECPV